MYGVFAQVKSISHFFISLFVKIQGHIQLHAHIKICHGLLNHAAYTNNRLTLVTPA